MIIEWIKDIVSFVIIFILVGIPIGFLIIRTVGDFWFNAINWLIKGVL